MYFFCSDVRINFLFHIFFYCVLKCYLFCGGGGVGVGGVVVVVIYMGGLHRNSAPFELSFYRGNLSYFLLLSSVIQIVFTPPGLISHSTTTTPHTNTEKSRLYKPLLSLKNSIVTGKQ